jgi:hypothetical protein
MAYFANTAENWKNFAAFDLHDLSRRVSIDAVNFPQEIIDKASALMAAADAVVLDSFAQGDYPGFVPGVHGLAVFFPKGDVWSDQSWYNSIDTVAAGLPPYENCAGVPMVQSCRTVWCKTGLKCSTAGLTPPTRESINTSHEADYAQRGEYHCFDY